MVHALQDADVRWWHWHPDYLPDDVWHVVRLAKGWRDGMLPRTGGIEEQPAMLVAEIEIVLTAWSKMEAAAMKRAREK
ncbi:hypothetical protein DXH95_03105 [Sphingorhabdus pulchriflava]|uniref:Uncharacterized protein n=1 Tax=Sphingorhabdus pulchriflava TaxID=2292257 RepID=A0A371BFQ3_9SPHN|nr:hypothetical protein [Sphingorhabdus pulchriflava]RDV06429.1 hypothetical protein DXH95_03105 [Sphingorhabdus pulchriflava]